ncbi:hypothetical protein [Haloarchaeobius sp. HME9146]|uniref:hypothetical protein n=1 Tax=Haloarchaeobius sp. HME9146 TaxID=2978732 RepID=UPI0021C13F61|nr:hypothetical protein [Haloarchaeobius sp. HME9146]MCT9094916.1 hypothetical protein [Haloarchaeobius sp. HME9146]
MNRRSLLAHASVLVLSGCLSQGDRGGPAQTTATRPSATTSSPPPSSETDTGTTTQTTQSAASPVSLETESQTIRTASAETPAVVELSLTNAGPEPVALLFGATPPLTNYRGAQVDGTGSIQLFPLDSQGRVGISNTNGDDEIEVKRYDGTCWVVEDTFSPVAILQQERLEPDESVEQQYEVLSSRDGCAPDGEYVFTEAVGFPESDDEVELSFRLEYPVV